MTTRHGRHRHLGRPFAGRIGLLLALVTLLLYDLKSGGRSP